MVGYSNESKAYRLYNPKTRKIIISRDATFFENEKEVIEIDKSNDYMSSVALPFGEDCVTLNNVHDNVNSEGEIGMEPRHFACGFN